MKNLKVRYKKGNKKIKKVLPAIMMALMMAKQQLVFAASVPGIDGTKRLGEDVTKGLLILIPVAMILALILIAFKWYFSEEDEKKRFKKPAIATVAVGVFAELCSGIVAFVLSYY
ncbi:MAG: TrbC/VirB2 family protein [Lachnospiraceae bacterium]